MTMHFLQHSVCSLTSGGSERLTPPSLFSLVAALFSLQVRVIRGVQSIKPRFI